jgi:hypothetical protein
LSRETNIPAITPRNNIIANTIPRIAGIDRAVCDAAAAEPDDGNADVVEVWEEVVLARIVDEAR